MSVLLNVFETPLQNFKVWKIPIVADPRVISQEIRELSQKRVADCSFSNGFLYFKGEPEKVIEELQKESIIVSQPPEEVILSPQREGKIIRDLLYSSFEGILHKKGWRAPIGKRKRALPEAYESYRDFYLELGENVTVIFGLKYMFEVSSRNSLRLWLDVYAPLWSAAEKHFLNKKDIDAKLRELYVQKALLRPKDRYKKTLKLIEILFGDEIIELEFCDDYCLSFSKEMYIVSPSAEEMGSEVSLSFNIIEEPNLRFKLGFSGNPKDIMWLKAYGYGASIRELHIKAIIDESTREDFLNFFKKLRDGFYGNYTRWPGFQTVTGAELSFDDKSDIIYLDNPSREAIQNCLLRVFSEGSGKTDKTVTLLVVPELLSKFYYEFKALALQKSMPLQVILEKTLKKEPLEFTLMNIGVALYTKGGGIPWILKNSLTQTHSLFVGISFHLDHESKNIYYGVMEVFDKFGKHLEGKIRMYSSPNEIKSVRGLYIPREDAEKILTELVRVYNPHEIIFHKSAPFHDEEKEAIENVCQNKGIPYCLVHIERTNPYRIYRMKGGDFTPIRGTIIFDATNESRAILSTTGHSILSPNRLRLWSGIGTPRPLEIVLEKNTTQHNLREIAEQIMAMTKLDWNTIEVSVRSPITLKYSNRAANMAPYLKKEIVKGPIEITDIRFLM
ncbi:Piwi domain-containing protein [Candidatus Methanodesulfokora washburnensis]|jgi:hypothetical protein|uniref:Piwi domain-containing protein n=1 Tax=Candidatus Methanodesulfokora washburnensis TaxID=2478471 RepID=A0A3R9PTJ9_9CREN|nr:Piwi domain-containing protein [Candidatus Methanodesulfokores washburnensis]RSN72685.1 hypothetical protein D6D85_12855 [Candidatus Methanodesulfokores washburnensis]